MHLDLYPCEEVQYFGSAKLDVENPYGKCDFEIKPYNLRFTTMGYLKSVNVKEFHNPVISTPKIIDYVVLSEKMRYQTNINIKSTQLTTHRGMLKKSLFDKMVTIEDTTHKNLPREDNHRLLNINDVYWKEDDVYWQLEVYSTNTREEITRSYFTLIDC